MPKKTTVPKVWMSKTIQYGGPKVQGPKAKAFSWPKPKPVKPRPAPEMGCGSHHHHLPRETASAKTIRLLTKLLGEVGKINALLTEGSGQKRVTLKDLKLTEKHIMSAISDWSAKVTPKLDKIQTGLDEVQALVEKLQTSPGAITPEDQATLDQIEQKVDAIATDADSVTPPPGGGAGGGAGGEGDPQARNR